MWLIPLIIPIQFHDSFSSWTHKNEPKWKKTTRQFNCYVTCIDKGASVNRQKCWRWSAVGGLIERTLNEAYERSSHGDTQQQMASKSNENKSKHMMVYHAERTKINNVRSAFEENKIAIMFWRYIFFYLALALGLCIWLLKHRHTYGKWRGAKPENKHDLFKHLLEMINQATLC